MRERLLPGSREELGLARATEHPGQRKLVAVLTRFAQDILELGGCSGEIVGVGEHARETAARAQHDRDALHPRLQRGGTLDERHLGSVSEEQLAPGNLRERLSEKRPIAEALSEAGSG